ncbi:MAG: iron dicitrate transport regulator FecR [Sphingomonadales bacterium]|nr:MAG: iron dicitrate transport regulator FecR [Sphingomonadales bacterium]
MVERDNDAAARWAVLRDGRTLTDGEQSELDAWLDADARRAGALFRAEAVLAYVGHEPGAEAAPSVHAPKTRLTRRRILAGGGFGIAAALAGVLAVNLSTARETYSTAVGEIRRIPLVDGSTATVNTDSLIRVSIQPQRREIQLSSGEVWFEVAPDANRPFVVEAGDVRVRAVGTAFSVRRHADGIDVLVTEGTVEVWRLGDQHKPVRVKQGQRSFVATDASAVAAIDGAPEIERALAWRSGELALKGEPLSYAVDELNRYNRNKIVIVDPMLGRTPIVGYFRADDPTAFANAVTAIAGARIEMDGDTIRLLAGGI